MTDNAHRAVSKSAVIAENELSDFSRVNYVEAGAQSDGQRLDNFLLRHLKGVPKSHVHRIVRAGEVRINKKRVDCDARVAEGDIIRIPPVRVSVKEADAGRAVPINEKELKVLFEDRDLLVVDKPAGLACHGGSGISFGLIERLRASRPEAPFLELAHRLDRDTSGVLIVCKTRKALVCIHEMQRQGEIRKYYRLMVSGDWVNAKQHVRLPLTKYTLASGERRVRVDEENGLKAHTIFTLLKRFGAVSYLEADLKTGRTHQIRVHAAAVGYPLIGDDKYGDYAFNDAVKKGSLGIPFERLFLHAFRLEFRHPVTSEPMTVVSPLAEDLVRLVNFLTAKEDSQ